MPLFKAQEEDSDSDSDISSTATENELDDPTQQAQRLGANLNDPDRAAISRKRKIQKNPPGKSRSTRGCVSMATSTTTQNEHLTAEGNRLRCDACKENISKKKNTVLKLIASGKHVQAKKVIELSKNKEQTLLQFLSKNDKANNPKSETLPHDMRVYRFDLVESFLAAGIPLTQVDSLRSFLEKYGYRLPSQTHLRQLIPSVHQKEKETLQKELSEHECSVIFDGSTRLGEALAIIVRFVDSEWNVQERLVSRFKHWRRA